MRSVRIIGIVLLLAALAFLAWEGVRAAGGAEGGWRPVAVGDLWYWIDPPSLSLLEAGIVRHVSEDFWYDVVFPLLQLPVWGLLGGLGLILLVLAFALGRRRRRRFRPS